MTGGILALDLSSHCGWAFGLPNQKPIFGVWELPSVSDAGRQGAAFCDALADAIKVHNPALVVMEADVNLHRQNPTPTAYQQIGMVYLTELVCYRRSVTVRQATAGDARTAVLGRSRWERKGGAKEAVLAWCKCQAWDVLDHNAADALLLWAYACKQPMRRAA